MNSTPSRLAVATALSFVTVAIPAFAQESPTEGPTESGAVEQPGDDLHNRQEDYQGNIIVSAEGLRELDLFAGTDVLEAEEIQRNLSGQIGEVLTKLPGVSATSFAPGASRPVLRGFQGERVRVLIDGLSTADVSNTSADHATTIDPLTAERIEVLRGPASLLYGSQAIGGAVNVIDKRIPRRIPDEDFHVDALAAYDSVNDQINTGASIDLPLSSNFVLHVDGTYRNSDDLEIGGFQVSPELREELFARADAEEAAGELGEAEELREAANQRGFLPNSATETYTVNGGLSFIKGGSIFGVSGGYYNTDYGVPGRPGFEEHGEEEGGEEEGDEGVSIGLEQYRADFLADLQLGSGFFERLKIRAGYSNYTHTEFEGAEVGTVFDSDSLEGRIELIQNETNVLRGSVGVQYFFRDFDAVGEEAFIPPNLTNTIAVFALQEYGDGPFQIEAAARYEHTSTEAQTLGIDRDFNTYSGAIGLAYDVQGALRVGVNLSRAERAPGAEELFADGPHIATQQFEIGDVDLSKETAWGVEGFVRGNVGGAEFNLSVYGQWFDDFIFLDANGDVEDDLPVFLIQQQDATYFGVEGEVMMPLFNVGDYQIITDLRGSYIDANLNDDGGPIPRIPPLQLLGALELQADKFDVRGEVQYFGEQNDVTAFENPTDDFTLVNFLVSVRPLPSNQNVTVILAADNIFDVIGRRHASFTKDFVPLGGRNLRASVRLSF